MTVVKAVTAVVEVEKRMETQRTGQVN